MENFDIRRSLAKPAQLTRSAAESIAIEVLTFLAEKPARLDRFLALSGLGRDSLRATAGEPGFFLAAILDHLASDEKLLLAFAARAGHEPSVIARARVILSPPAEMP